MRGEGRENGGRVEDHRGIGISPSRLFEHFFGCIINQITASTASGGTNLFCHFAKSQLCRLFLRGNTGLLVPYL
jgi:hypothetical protein